MKLKALSLVAGAIALSLTTTFFAVHAQTASTSSMLLAQTPEKRRCFRYSDLGLTDAQKKQIEKIARDSHTKIEGVYTPEQKAKVAAAIQVLNGQEQALSQIQKNELQLIHESEKQQIQAVYTPEQRQKIEEMRRNYQQKNPG